MAALPYIQFYVADYLADTMHLEAEEHGAYLLLLFNYWQTGKPLPNDDHYLMRVARVSNERWPVVKQTLQRLFNVTDAHWEHSRVAQDLARVRAVQAQRSEAGRKSAAQRERAKNDQKDTGCAKKSASVPTPVEQALPERCNEKATNKDTYTYTYKDNKRLSAPSGAQDDNVEPAKDQSDKPNPARSQLAIHFETFWKAYPVKRNKKRSLDIWKRKKLDSIAQALIDDVTQRQAQDGAWLDGYIPLPSTYLNGERWHDELNAAPGRAKNQNGSGASTSALEKVLAGIEATDQRRDEQALGDDDSAVRPSMDEQLRDGGGPDGRMGCVLEGDYTRQDEIGI